MDHAAKLLKDQSIFIGSNVLVYDAMVRENYSAVVIDLSSHMDMGITEPDILVLYENGKKEWVSIYEIEKVY